MKHRWLHVAAAFVGLVMAGVVVVLVFGSADEEGAKQTADAPQSIFEGESSTEDCGKYPPAQARIPAAVNDAAAHLPLLLNENDQEAVPKDPAQKAWFARVHAALGACIEEIVVVPRAISVSATLPETIDPTILDQYAYVFLTEAFSAPFNPARLTLEIDVDGEDAPPTRRLVVTNNAWAGFLASRGLYNLPSSIKGLRAAKRSIGYTDRELRFANW